MSFTQVLIKFAASWNLANSDDVSKVETLFANLRPSEQEALARDGVETGNEALNNFVAELATPFWR